MAYDEALARRIREVLGDQPGLVEKKMFGGIGYLVDGNMACGVYRDSLIVRVGPEAHHEAQASPHLGNVDRPAWPAIVARGALMDMAAPRMAGGQDRRATMRWSTS